MLHPSQYIHRLMPEGLLHPWHISEAKELFLSISLRTIGMSMVGIFVPTLLYVKGYSLVDIGLYHVVMIIFRFAGTLIASKVIARIGPKHVLALSYFAGMAFVLSLIGIERFDTHWWLASLLHGLYLALYFTSTVVDLSKITSSKEGGSRLGWFQAFTLVSAALGPLISGFVTVRYGFTVSLVAAFILIAVATLPLFVTPEPMKTPLIISYQGLFSRKHLRDYVSQTAFTATNLSAAAIWPLFLSVVVLSADDFQSLGFLTSLAFFAAVILSPLVGRYSDKVQSYLNLMRGGSFATGCLGILRILVSSAIPAAVLGSLIQVSLLFTKIPFTKGRMIEFNTNKGQRISTVVMFEMASIVGYLLIWAIFMLSALLLDDVRTVFVVTFILSSALSVLIPLQRDRTIAS